MAGKPARSGPPGNKNGVKHGYYSLVKMIKGRGGALDRRTILGKMLVTTMRQLESDLGGDLSEAQRMLIEDVALDTLLLQGLNRKVASVQPICKGKTHAAYQLRSQLIAQRREHLRLLYPAGLHRRIKTPSINDLLNQDANEKEAVNAVDGNGQSKMDTDSGQSFNSQPLTTSERHSGRCQNPFCASIIEPLLDGEWRRTERRYCSDRCRTDGYVLRRAKTMMAKVGIIEFYRLLEEV